MSGMSLSFLDLPEEILKSIFVFRLYNDDSIPPERLKLSGTMPLHVLPQENYHVGQRFREESRFFYSQYILSNLRKVVLSISQLAFVSKQFYRLVPGVITENAVKLFRYYEDLNTPQGFRRDFSPFNRRFDSFVAFLVADRFPAPTAPHSLLSLFFFAPSIPDPTSFLTRGQAEFSPATMDLLFQRFYPELLAIVEYCKALRDCEEPEDGDSSENSYSPPEWLRKYPFAAAIHHFGSPIETLSSTDSVLQKVLHKAPIYDAQFDSEHQFDAEFSIEQCGALIATLVQGFIYAKRDDLIELFIRNDLISKQRLYMKMDQKRLYVHLLHHSLSNGNAPLYRKLLETLQVDEFSPELFSNNPSFFKLLLDSKDESLFWHYLENLVPPPQYHTAQSGAVSDKELRSRFVVFNVLEQCRLAARPDLLFRLHTHPKLTFKLAPFIRYFRDTDFTQFAARGAAAAPYEDEAFVLQFILSKMEGAEGAMEGASASLFSSEFLLYAALLRKGKPAAVKAHLMPRLAPMFAKLEKGILLDLFRRCPLHAIDFMLRHEYIAHCGSPSAADTGLDPELHYCSPAHSAAREGTRDSQKSRPDLKDAIQESEKNLHDIIHTSDSVQSLASHDIEETIYDENDHDAYYYHYHTKLSSLAPFHAQLQTHELNNVVTRAASLTRAVSYFARCTNVYQMNIVMYYFSRFFRDKLGAVAVQVLTERLQCMDSPFAHEFLMPGDVPIARESTFIEFAEMVLHYFAAYINDDFRFSICQHILSSDDPRAFQYLISRADFASLTLRKQVMVHLVERLFSGARMYLHDQQTGPYILSLVSTPGFRVEDYEDIITPRQRALIEKYLFVVDFQGTLAIPEDLRPWLAIPPVLYYSQDHYARYNKYITDYTGDSIFVKMLIFCRLFSVLRFLYPNL